MATSDGLDGCLQRGRSQSDPNILTEPGIDLAHCTGKIHVIVWVFICSICRFSIVFFDPLVNAAVSKRRRCSPGGASRHRGIISACVAKLGHKIRAVAPNHGAANRK